MKPADEIEQFFGDSELGIDPATDEKVFEDVSRAHREAMEDMPAVPQLWRIIVKSPATGVGAAAVLIVACLIGAFLINETSGVAWAIEESIEALSKYDAVLVEGSESELYEAGELKTWDIKSWSVANEDQTKVEKERHEVDGIPILITNGRETWRYDPQTNTVTKNLPYGTPEGWIGRRFLEQLRAYHESGVMSHWEATYGKDPVTGRQRAFLAIAWLDQRYNGPRSMWLEFDVESKLVVSLKQWENSNWQGPPRIVSEKITYYESLPDGLFEFNIPEGATVIEHQTVRHLN